MLARKESDYFSAVREDIIELVDTDTARILDVGCGCGMTGRKLKENGAREVVGIELDSGACEEAKKNLDKVLSGDVEKIDLPFKEDYFDFIIYADVLEHLVDPWGTLKKHTHFLRKGGTVIASIPNVRHYRVVKKLLKGSWDYEKKGVMDSTHLRFFTLDGIKKMFKDADLELKEVVYKISASRNKKFMNKLLRGRLNEILSEQFLIKAIRT